MIILKCLEEGSGKLYKRRILFKSHQFSGKIVHKTVKLNDKQQKRRWP